MKFTWRKEAKRYTSNQIRPKQIKRARTVDSTANREGRAVGDLASLIKDRISKSCVDLNKM